MERVAMEECASVDAAAIVEREWCVRLGATLNRCVPGRTHREWHADHRKERKAKAREWHAAHREEANAKSREYWTTHRDERNAKRREKVTCECGDVVTRGVIARHRRSNKHLMRIALFTDNE